jgi:hypothetical protein
MKPNDTANEKTALEPDAKPVMMESPALVPAARSHADKFRAAAQAVRRCAADVSHWDKVHAASGIEP